MPIEDERGSGGDADDLRLAALASARPARRWAREVLRGTPRAVEDAAHWGLAPEHAAAGALVDAGRRYARRLDESGDCLPSLVDEGHVVATCGAWAAQGRRRLAEQADSDRDAYHRLAVAYGAQVRVPVVERDVDGSRTLGERVPLLPALLDGREVAVSSTDIAAQLDSVDFRGRYGGRLNLPELRVRVPAPDEGWKSGAAARVVRTLVERGHGVRPVRRQRMVDGQRVTCWALTRAWLAQTHRFAGTEVPYRRLQRPGAECQDDGRWGGWPPGLGEALTRWAQGLAPDAEETPSATVPEGVLDAAREGVAVDVDALDAVAPDHADHARRHGGRLAGYSVREVDGRWYLAGGASPQNLPRTARSAIRPAPGKVLVAVDVDGCHVGLAAADDGQLAADVERGGGADGLYRAWARTWGVERAPAKRAILAWLNGAGVDGLARALGGDPVGAVTVLDHLGWRYRDLADLRRRLAPSALAARWSRREGEVMGPVLDAAPRHLRRLGGRVAVPMHDGIVVEVDHEHAATASAAVAAAITRSAARAGHTLTASPEAWPPEAR